jgi:hypothetical protein
MFETSDKFSSLEEMQKQCSTCPFCKKQCEFSGTYNQRIHHFVCKDADHHYESRSRRYKYARRTYYRLAKERLDIHALYIYLSREYDWSGGREKKYIQISAKNKGGIVRKYSPVRFNKLFNPTDTVFFLKRLESISKAIVLMG